MAAGLPKLFSLAQFAESVAAYQLLHPSLIYLVASTLPFMETLLGLSLLIGWRIRLCAQALACISGLFALGIARALHLELEIDCGCFAVPLRIGWSHILLNCVCLLVGVWLAKGASDRFSLDARVSSFPKAERIVPWAALALLLFSSNWHAYELGRGHASPPKTVTIAGDPAGGSGGLTFETRTLELGSLSEGEVLTRKVEYRNDSSAQIKIEEVKASCGCTVPKLQRRTLEPGQTGSMTVKYTAGSHPGPFERTIRVKHNADAKPTVLKVVGEVKPTVAIVPHFANLAPGQQAEFEMAPIAPGDTGLKVTRVEVSNPKLEAVILGSDPVKGTWRFRVGLTEMPTPEETKRSKAVEIYTNRAKEPFRFHVVLARSR